MKNKSIALALIVASVMFSGCDIADSYQRDMREAINEGRADGYDEGYEDGYDYGYEAGFDYAYDYLAEDVDYMYDISEKFLVDYYDMAEGMVERYIDANDIYTLKAVISGLPENESEKIIDIVSKYYPIYAYCDYVGDLNNKILHCSTCERVEELSCYDTFILGDSFYAILEENNLTECSECFYIITE